MMKFLVLLISLHFLILSIKSQNHVGGGDSVLDNELVPAGSEGEIEQKSEIIFEESEIEMKFAEEEAAAGNWSQNIQSNWSQSTNFYDQVPIRDPLYIVIPISLIYSLILLSGLLGNISTCIVIAKNNYMHTATNYYLFSLAISDLLLLISGLPQEMYLNWFRYPYIFGEIFCVGRGLAAESSANASVLTIAAFTVERYVAICHPLRSHSWSQLSRVIRIVLLIWIFAFALAIPQAAQFGVIDEINGHGQVLIPHAWCSIKREIFPYTFQISIFVMFVIPMTIIAVLYILIGLKLRAPKSSRSHRGQVDSGSQEITVEPRSTSRHSQKHVIRMLEACSAAFFICWFPFHLQRLLAIYARDLMGAGVSRDTFLTAYKIINYLSGILYYVSTCINPILYHIMSNKFRQAFRDTVRKMFGSDRHGPPHRTYSTISHNFGNSSLRSTRYLLPQHILNQQRRTLNGQPNGNGHSNGNGNGNAHGLGHEVLNQLNLPQNSNNPGQLNCEDCRNSQISCNSCSGKNNGNSDGNKNGLAPIIPLHCLEDKSQGRKWSSSVKTSPPAKQGIGSLRNFFWSKSRGTRGIGGNQDKFLVKSSSLKRGDKSHGKLSRVQRSGSSSSGSVLFRNGRTTTAAGDWPIKSAASHTSVNSSSCKSNNTISNTSLQDLEETEFTGAELASILAELSET